MVRLPTDRPPTRPGDLLLEEFLCPLGITHVEFAKCIDVPLQRVNEIIKGERGVTPNTALCLEAAVGAIAQFWLNAETAWEILASLAFA